MTNFDFLKETSEFASFADVAISAEKLLHIDVDACVLNCRRAMEFAVKWMYSVDRELVLPYQDNLVALMNDEKFREIVGNDVFRRMEFIRKVGNNAAHVGKKVTTEQAEFYIRQHQNETAIAKLKSNIPLNADDIKSLEEILWSEVGSKREYEAEYGEKPLGEFVREIVGLDMAAAKEAFATYLNDVNLDARQIYFVNQIVEYIVHNGVMKDMSVLQEAPFTDRGSIAEIFTDMSLWLGIRGVINQINANAAA